MRLTKDQVILGAATVSSFILWILYNEPEDTEMLFSKLSWYTGLNLYVQPEYDVPAIFPTIFIIVFLYFLGNAAFTLLKVQSDRAVAGGVKYAESCVSSHLECVGDWGFLRVGGVKAFPESGTKVWIGLLSHIRKIGNTIVFDGHLIPDQDLVYTPFEIKYDVRQRRDGLFGLNKCSVGYLSAEELEQHREFKTDDFQEDLGPEQKDTTVLNTASFISTIAEKNRAADMGIQTSNNENESISKWIRNVTKIGQTVTEGEKKGLFQQIFGG